MKLDKLRNIGIIAHVDAGKTTFTERVLFAGGETHDIGNVDSGNTTTDSSAQEKAKGITISSAAVSINWSDTRINIIDTPGHIDFHVEVHRSLRVLDGAVVVFDSVAGVESQSESNWRLADQYGVPRIALVNKMDRVGADFDNVLEMIESRLNANPVAVQMPIGVEDGFQGVIDLVAMNAIIWPDEKSMEFEVTDIPDELKSRAAEYRDYLEAQLVELDDEVMMDWLTNERIDNHVLSELLRKATLSGYCIPVMCASAYKNKGVQPVLDAVKSYLPSPIDAKSVEALNLSNEKSIDVIADVDATMSALAFKVVNDQHGSLTYIRVYSGTLRTGDKVFNSSKGKIERIGRMYQMQAETRIARDVVFAGEIVALVGLKNTSTGDSLCSQDRPLLLERIEIPKSVIDIVVEAKSREDEAKLSQALDKMLKEDPSLKMHVNDVGQTVLSGLGELHLEIVVDKLKTDFDVSAQIGQPQVAYRESLTESCDIVYKHKKQGGGPGQYAVVHLSFSPIKGDEIEFDSQVVGASIPKEFIPGVEKGIREAAKSGVIAGYSCGGFRAVLTDGEAHENDSSLLAFQIAAKEAFKQAALQMHPVLMEPMMNVEVVTSQEYIGDCIGDLSKRRGLVSEQEMRASNVVISASVPLSAMFGYIGTLRSLTAGRASFSMTFDKYAEVPERIKDKIIGGK